MESRAEPPVNLENDRPVELNPSIWRGCLNKKFGGQL